MVANVEALVSWILQFGDAAEIISPESARAVMRAKLAPFLEGDGGNEGGAAA
jgi:predicted DNA-binding transcriptional regulator YafY